MNRNKIADVAESIIRCEALTFALAVKFGGEDDLRKSRASLKDRLIKELSEAHIGGWIDE